MSDRTCAVCGVPVEDDATCLDERGERVICAGCLAGQMILSELFGRWHPHPPSPERYAMLVEESRHYCAVLRRKELET